MRVLRAGGADLTPRAAKARGLLAILGAEPGLRLSRARLQDLLWSDRGQEQGAASLRQALAEIRRGLGAARDVLLTGPGWIGLDAMRVSVVLPGVPGAADGFATDLDLRDPEFEDWIRDRRNAFATTDAPAAAAAPSLHRSAPIGALRIWIPGADIRDEPVAQFVLTEAARRIDEFYPAETTLGRDPPPDGADFTLRARTLRGDRTILVNLALQRTASDMQLWSQAVPIPTADLEGGLGRAAELLASATLDHVAVEGRAGGVGEGLSDVFAFSFDRLDRLDRDLSRFAGSIGQSARVGALRAYLRYTMLLERCAPDAAETLAEARSLSRRALEAAPGNPVVQIVAALVGTRQGDHALALELAGAALASSPHGAFIRSAAAACLAAAGRPRLAPHDGPIPQTGGLADRGAATYAIRNAGIAIRLGEEQRALHFARIAESFAADCRPAHRFIAALAFRAGDEAMAEDALRRLRASEPDFSLRLMREADYPVASLRAAGFLQVAASDLLGE